MRVLLAPLEAGAGRYETPENDILLEAAQAVNRTAKRRVYENLRSLLKGRGGEERTARESALLDAEHYLARLRD